MRIFALVKQYTYMILSDKDIKRIEQIEAVICKYASITLKELYAINTSRKASFFRSYLFYIIHVDMDISIGCICKRYNRQPRSVFTAIAKIKYLINNQKAYRAEYDELCVRINK